MGARSTAAFHSTLTNYAVGLAQDLTSALAEFLAPTVPVSGTVGQYKRYNDKNAFAVYDTARAIGGPATRIEFAADDPTYNCKPQALEAPIDDASRDAAGDAQSELEEGEVKTLVTNAVLSHEVKVINAINASVTAVAGKGVWSNPANDPVLEIDELILAIAEECGMMPNRIAMGMGAWHTFRHHPKVIERQPGAQLVGINTSQAASMLDNPGIDWKVGMLSRDLNKAGKGKNAKFVIGENIYVFYGSPSPTKYDPSFAKTFTGRRGGVTAVRTYREEQNRSDIFAVDWSEDIQVVSTSCVRRLTLS